MTYEYLCSECNYEWEQEQKITDNVIEECPKCGKRTVKRLISCENGFILKGGGWYREGYSSTKNEK